MSKRFTQKFSGGFTLIELLVVITTIGILSAVILAALGGARAKGSDASVKSGLVNIRSQIEVYYNNSGETYGSWNGGGEQPCPTSVVAGAGIMSNTSIIKGINAALVSGGNGTRCIVTPGAYAVSVGMKTSGQS